MQSVIDWAIKVSTIFDLKLDCASNACKLILLLVSYTDKLGYLKPTVIALDCPIIDYLCSKYLNSVLFIVSSEEELHSD